MLAAIQMGLLLIGVIIPAPYEDHDFTYAL